MSAAECIDCGKLFDRPPNEEWKARCFRCWRAQARHSGAWQRPRPTRDDELREVAEHLTLLLQLVHPDRHDGSQAATKATQWLLDLRRRLAVLERAA